MVFRTEQRLFSGVENGKKLTTPEELYAYLVKRVAQYRPKKELKEIRAAYELARASHRDQVRRSGEPYIIHPLWVAIILSELELGKESIIAGLLHDVVEDTGVSYEDVAERFSSEVADIVDGVTKLGQLTYSNKEDEQAENLRKMFMAMAKDIRVMMVKLADRLHNMRTLEHMPREKQIAKATETQDIYCPIAGRLGVSVIKVELDDLCLKFLHPTDYETLAREVDAKLAHNQDFVEDLIHDVKHLMFQSNIKAEVYGRVKHLFSIYKKMIRQDKAIDEILDLFAIRILVKNIKDCYAALGFIHETYTPIPGHIKDYIAMPKQNNYQSLHTSVIGPGGQPFEVQIRTYEMHRIAEYGIAAHWKYKEKGNSDNQALSAEEVKLNWLRQIVDWDTELTDNKEFMETVRSDLDLFTENVYCFTPKGDVKQLPAGSTPVDLAYVIHTAIGNQMIGARVNGRLVNIDYKIKNGDRVEIITSANSHGPSRDWLNFVRSTSARTKINQFFKKELKLENVSRGREALQEYAKAHNIFLSEITKPAFKEAVQKKYGFGNWDAVLAAVGHGGVKEGQIINRLLEEAQREKERNLTDQDVLDSLANATRGKGKRDTSGVVVDGAEGVAIHFSKCCSPVPGDEIVGYVTRGRGVSVHRKDCENLKSMLSGDPTRLIPVHWRKSVEESGGRFNADIKVFCNNRKGLIIDVTRILTERQIDIKGMSCRVSKKGVCTIEISFDVYGRNQLTTIIDSIRMVPDVIDIERAIS